MFTPRFCKITLNVLMVIAVPLLLVTMFEIIPLIYGASALVVLLFLTIVFDLLLHTHIKGDF